MEDHSEDLSGTRLDELLDDYGIASSYTEFSGHIAQISRENRLGILAALGVTIESADQLAELLRRHRINPFEHLLPPVQVLPQEHAEILLSMEENSSEYLHWQLQIENGETRTGTLVPDDLETVSRHEIEGRQFVRKKFILDALPLGYHELIIKGGTSNDISCLLIRSPVSTFQPEWLQAGKKIWGLSAQLYTLNSSGNWGIGDFSDLFELIGLSVKQGADFILLNPLHALDITRPDHPSPYSPVDRRFLNPLYISPQWCEGFVEEEALGCLRELGLETRLAECRSGSKVDYEGVFEIKFALFVYLYKKFRRELLLKRSTEIKREYKSFIKEGGKSLQGFAAYQAGQKIPCLRLRGKKDFFLYLQWQASRQFKRCQEHSLQQGMLLGLVNDFAVGSVAKGYEVSSNPELFADSARIGAPPDNFNPDGQNWGMPPLNPEKLKQNRFAHFIDLLRDNMKNCGALRIDHVMALMRLWWCLESTQSAFDKGAGAYVYYPVDELFAILRLESSRANCMIIGEDLGVVPPEIRQYLNSAGILSNLVFYFEKYDGWHFRKPEDFKTHALTMITNHDVPTLKAWWDKSDLTLRRKIGLIASEEKLATEHQYRDGEKQQLLAWLDELHLLPQGWNSPDINRIYDFSLGAAISKGCALANSVLVSIQLDDLAGLEEPVNIPGTCEEYGNWRRKIPMQLNSLFQQEGAQVILSALREGRNSW